MHEVFHINAENYQCPIPVLKLRKRLSLMAPLELVKMTATDQAALIDVPVFCAQEGHELLEIEPGEKLLTFLVRKKGPHG